MSSSPDTPMAQARARALDAADAARDTIQTKPFVSVGLVFVVSLALGLSLGFALSRD